MHAGPLSRLHSRTTNTLSPILPNENHPAPGITFRNDFGMWWPDYDHKPEQCHKRVMSRLKDVDVGMKYCSHKRVAVQAGGHAGIWPRRLARFFERVFTFEPEPELYRCLVLNLETVSNVECYPYALGADRRTVKLQPHVSAGSWKVSEDGKFPVMQIRIDDLALPNCDLIALDIEGYEVEALLGAKETIRKFSPVIYVEELERSILAIRSHLSSLNYVRKETVHNDAVYIPAT